jgi:hypothetical protein
VREIGLMTLLPFQEALGTAIEAVAPAVGEHFLQPSGTRRYRGVMRRVWRRTGWRGLAASPLLWLGSWTDTLFAETGNDVPFELDHTVTLGADGRAAMRWSRTFHFPRCRRCFEGLMRYEPGRGVVVERLGRRLPIEVELHAQVDQGAILLVSGRQQFCRGRLHLPIPRWLAGGAEIREWEEPDGSLGVCVTVSNPLLGAFFGYEGWFRKVE